MSFNLNDYFPVLLMFIVAAGFAVTFITLSQFVGQRKSTRTKLMPYECGKDPVGSAHERFSVKFYLIAMIFILFDIEVIFLVPWAVVFKTLASPQYGLRNLVYFEMLLFIALLAAGLIYVIKKGAFDWSQRARREAEAEGRLLAEVERRQPMSDKLQFVAAKGSRITAEPTTNRSLSDI
jgi:NADH-quinone oxidoreductase subunit A